MLPQFYALLCDAERIKKLLEEGTDPNIRDGDGNTPLHFAASKGCAEAARLLLEHGAELKWGKYLRVDSSARFRCYALTDGRDVAVYQKGEEVFRFSL